jgi:predicted RNA binding protein YcfA (HicA-like mRNA interferase family)
LPKLPALTGQRTVRALQRAGFLWRRTTGSHVILVDPEGGHTVSVPLHAGRTLSRGIVHDIIRQAGMTAEEFARHLT